MVATPQIVILLSNSLEKIYNTFHQGGSFTMSWMECQFIVSHPEGNTLNIFITEKEEIET